MIKIKILVDVPVEKKHGITIGREFDAIISPTDVPIHKVDKVIGVNPYGKEVIEVEEYKDYYDWFYRGRNYFWVQGDAGEAVKIWGNEAEVIYDDNSENSEA